MRILLVTDQYAPAIGGIETLLRQVARELADRGHALEVLTGSQAQARDRRQQIDGITVHRVDLVRALSRRDPFAVATERARARAVVDAFRPDLIHAHDAGPVLWAVAGRGTPTLITIHTSLGIYEHSQIAPMARQIGACDWVTCVSQAVLDEVVAVAPSVAPRASVIVNGVPVGPLPPAPSRVTRRIAAVGRMAPSKGFDVLVRAFALIAAHDPRVELELIGDGPARAEIAALVDRLGLTRRVAMPGTIRHRDVADVLARASVVAIPSRWEGMPLVALEAGRAARPVVATPVQGLGEVVIDQVTGLLVPVDDAAALAGALAELLDDPDRAAALGAEGHARVTAEYSLGTAVAAYEALYAELATDRASAAAPAH